MYLEPMERHLRSLDRITQQGCQFSPGYFNANLILKISKFFPQARQVDSKVYFRGREKRDRVFAQDRQKIPWKFLELEVCWLALLDTKTYYYVYLMKAVR